MPDTGVVLFFLGLLVMGLFLEPLAARARMPVSVFLVPLGFAASEIATRVAGLDVGIRWDNLGTFITYVLVPSLVFESALRLDTDALRRDAAAVFLLAFPLLLLAAGITAGIAYAGIGHPDGFPWAAALLAGAILSSTEMTGMFQLLTRAGASNRIAWILEGESIFNDTAALLLFMLMLSVALMDVGGVTVSMVATDFARLFLGGIIVGYVCGFLARGILRRVPGEHTFAVLSLATAYGVFLLAQKILQVSGALAVLTAGVLLCSDLRRHRHNEAFPEALWNFVAHTAGSMIFILAGVSITLGMFRDEWLAMLVGAVAVLAARAVTVFAVLGPISYLPGFRPLSIPDQAVLTWGSVRGSVTMALALSLPLQLEYWYSLQALVYGAVLFSLFVQATTVSRLVGRFRLPADTAAMATSAAGSDRGSSAATR